MSSIRALAVTAALFAAVLARPNEMRNAKNLEPRRTAIDDAVPLPSPIDVEFPPSIPPVALPSPIDVEFPSSIPPVPLPSPIDVEFPSSIPPVPLPSPIDVEFPSSIPPVPLPSPIDVECPPYGSPVPLPSPIDVEFPSSAPPVSLPSPIDVEFPEPILTCATVLCAPEHYCEDVDGKPRCIPGVQCGPSLCTKGNVCCNESCGICTPPDAGCIKLFCDGPVFPVDTAEDTSKAE